MFLKKILPERAYGGASRLFSKGRSYYYRGNQRECPLCGGHFRRFLPTGASNRPNAQCPRCHSLERHRLLWFYFMNCTDLFKENSRVLHFAPEYCFRTKFDEADNIDYYTADLAEPNVMYHINIEEIPFEDDFFDVVIANHVLEHVEDDTRAMKEIIRVLKPKGWALLQVPLDVNRSETYEDKTIITPEDRARAFGQEDHVRVYGRDYAQRLQSAGFTVKVVAQEHLVSPDMIVKYGFYPSEEISVCMMS